MKRSSKDGLRFFKYREIHPVVANIFSLGKDYRLFLSFSNKVLGQSKLFRQQYLGGNSTWSEECVGYIIRVEQSKLEKPLFAIGGSKSSSQ